MTGWRHGLPLFSRLHVACQCLFECRPFGRGAAEVVLAGVKVEASSKDVPACYSFCGCEFGRSTQTRHGNQDSDMLLLCGDCARTV